MVFGFERLFSVCYGSDTSRFAVIVLCDLYGSCLCIGVFWFWQTLLFCVFAFVLVFLGFCCLG